MIRAGAAIVGAISIACSTGTSGEVPPPTGPAAGTRTADGPPPTDPTASTPPAASAAMTSETFVDLVLSLPPGLVRGDDTREEVRSPIPGAPPTAESFRSYNESGASVLHLFAWDGAPVRDRGPMQAVESWKLRIDTSEASVSRTSYFFGGKREVLVAHFEGPPPARRRYMIYTTKIDRAAFEALLGSIRFAPQP